MHKKRFRLLVVAYALILFIALVGLIVNANTVPLSQELQEAETQLHELEQQNSELQLQLSSRTQLRQVEIKAKALFGMKFPDKIIYLNENSDEAITF